MSDRVYRVPIVSLGLQALLVISAKERPKAAHPDQADLYVHIHAPDGELPNDREVLSRLDECLDILEKKKESGRLHVRPSRIRITPLQVYMRHEHGEAFTMDTMIALFEGLTEHLDRLREPESEGDDSSQNVGDSEEVSE